MTMTKQEVLELMRDLPEEFDIEQLMYRLYVLQRIQEGERAIEQGRFVSHEEAKRRISEWRS
jgi:predicted transcriptional regulator